MALYLYNSLTRKKELFIPLDENNVRMYVCGPTVYNRPHLGNARSIVVYDVLYRVLQHLYTKECVTYIRNITDVDDKIITAAKDNNEAVDDLTTRVTKQFHEDISELNVLVPTHEPRARNHVNAMIEMIKLLISNGHAYEKDGHVLFDISSFAEHGCLSHRKNEESPISRVEYANYKRNQNDFVLWKPPSVDDTQETCFYSPWGLGRPGWHIECSAMSTKYLGKDFDIHGGGADLMFPHHENEIAQSRCALPGSNYAKYWVHNGFLNVVDDEGTVVKMSKSLGNIITVRTLLDKGINGEVIRFALLKTKYNEPMDWNDRTLKDAKKELDSLYRKVGDYGTLTPNEFYISLCNDLNTPKAISVLHDSQGYQLKSMGALLGILQQDPKEWFMGLEDNEEIMNLIEKRAAAKKLGNYSEADMIRSELDNDGIVLEDRSDGTTSWHRK